MTLTELKEYKYMVEIPFTEVKKGMIVVEQDLAYREGNSISYFCRVEDCYQSDELSTGFDYGWTLDLSALSKDGEKLFDWEMGYLFEYEEDAFIEIYFKERKEASLFGIDPDSLETANYDQFFVGDYEDADALTC